LPTSALEIETDSPDLECDAGPLTIIMGRPGAGRAAPHWPGEGPLSKGLRAFQ
jgi:hypothetical protein